MAKNRQKMILVSGAAKLHICDFVPIPWPNEQLARQGKASLDIVACGN
jgi:hypothetical protein